MAFDLLLAASPQQPRVPRIAEQLAQTADRFVGASIRYLQIRHCGALSQRREIARRRHRFNADFKFILLNSRASMDDEISPFNQFTIRAYRVLKKLSLSAVEDFGLEVANIEVETVPISIGKAKDIQLKREY